MTVKSALGILAATLLSFSASAEDFNGAVPQPIGKIESSTSQLTIRFPEAMVKADAFKVTCSGQTEGYSSWADNDSLWTYNFKAKSEHAQATLPGGTDCEVTQTEEIASVEGKTWPVGTINYKVSVAGPNVIKVLPAAGFGNTLRESEATLLITFDGDVNREKFFANQSGYISYTSANLPAEKMPLTPVPGQQLKEIFDHFQKNHYLYGIEFEDKNWVLATVRRELIPGSQVSLVIKNVVSAYNSANVSSGQHTEELQVRSDFKAEIRCASRNDSGSNCLPNSPIEVVFNGKVKWADAKTSYIEYVPYKSTDGKRIRAYPELSEDTQSDMFDTVLDTVGEYLPSIGKFSDTLVESITFNVQIEPQTQAKIVLAENLKDIDGRTLNNPLSQFFIFIGSMKEIMRVPHDISFFEKNVDNLALPVGIVNLNQKIVVRKTGTNQDEWLPIQSMRSIIALIRGYAALGEYRETAEYVSPLTELGLASTRKETQLTGTKNRGLVFQIPFSAPNNARPGGLYAIEISSPSLESANSEAEYNRYYNPRHVLAQVTDLSVHLKKGKTRTTVWVTSLSGGQPINGASIEIYNCLGELKKATVTDASGLVSIANQAWADDCQASDNDWEPYFRAEEFYVVARAGDDFTFSHSSWDSPNTYALSAPGMEWYYSAVEENTPYYHAVIGINLVKPGQKVPVQILAKRPGSNGFSEVAAQKLAHTARIVSSDNSDLYYDFPLTWSGGRASFDWSVPADASVRLGRYTIRLLTTDSIYPVSVHSGGDIEVAEFKVPLMSGILSFPNQALVRPDSIPVNAVIRYANGVGAQKLPVELSYYFEPTAIHFKNFSEFLFGSGEVRLEEAQVTPTTALPDRSRPAVIEGLVTNSDGAIAKELATEVLSNGQTIGEALKESNQVQKLVTRLRYQDQMGEFQTLSQAKDIFNSQHYVGTQLIAGQRADAKLRAVAVDVNGKVATSAAQLELKVMRVETKIIGEELYGGLIKNTIERELKPVRWTQSCSTSKGVITCAVGNLKAGSYAFQAQAKAFNGQAAHTLFKVDSEGRVYNEGDYYYFGDEQTQKQLPLALNKKSYKDGDKAVVSFPAPFKTCNALVSIERSEVIEAFVVNDACQKGHVEVTVKADLAPNAFVSVYAITGRASDTEALKLGDLDLGRPTYRLGFANMKVNWERFKANVAVRTAKEKYEPGETVEVEVAVQPAQGGQIANGKVTVVALEEKILELKDNQSYQVLNAMMQLRNHDVRTVTPLDRVETVTAKQGSEQELAQDDKRKGGEEGGDGSSGDEMRRRLFDALVTFQADVPVVNGVAKVSFKANDSLTRFKVIAIATGQDSRFGTGEAVYLTATETQTYSNIPEVAYTGDRYPVRVTIQNNAAADKQFRTEVSVVLKDSNGKIISERTLKKSVNINKATSQAVEVGDLEVSEDAVTMEYVVRVYDETGKLVDILEPKPQVIMPSLPLAIHHSYLRQVQSTTLSLELIKERSALPTKGEIRATLANSLVNGAVSQISRKLAADPFSDFFIEAKIYKALFNSSADKPEELQKVLNELVGYLDNYGYIKYFPNAVRGDVWLTAEVIQSLQTEPWAMKLVPDSVRSAWLGAVSKVLTRSVPPAYIGDSAAAWMRAQAKMGVAAFAFNDPELEAAAKAVATTIESQLLENPAAFGETIEKWNNGALVDYWLLQVSARGSEALKSDIYAQLKSRLIFTGNAAVLRGQPSFWSALYSDETIETSRLLHGHAQLNGSSDLARNLATGLVSESQTRWYMARSMMRVSQALKAFAATYESVAVSGSSILVMVEEKQTQEVKWAQTSSATIAAPWSTQRETVQVNHYGSGQPWLAVEGLTATPLAEARGQGLQIEKSLRNVNRQSGYQVGDMIEVTLTVHAAASVSHIAMIDPIPAGSNILGEAYGSYSAGEKSYKGYKFHFERLPAGKTVVKYQFQLNNPGTFKLPPTRAEGLFMPSVFGEAPNASMTVTQIR